MEHLYHKQVGFPKNLKVPAMFENLEYSFHAKEAARNDLYGNIVLPNSVDIHKSEVVEIGLTNSVLSKIVVRASYDERRDIILVIIPERRFVKTVWFNLKTDTHRTLDKTKYRIPN